jgi:hypothetical protein
MRSLKLSQVLEVHEDSRPVWRIVGATGTPEGDVRRMIRVYQRALDGLTGSSRHITESARTAVAEHYVALMSRDMGADCIAERVGISLELAYRCLARINRTHKRLAPHSGGEQGAKTLNATLTRQSGPL